MLRARAEEIASEWGLTLGASFASSSWSYVAPAGEHAVLKVRGAEDWESDHDVDALLRWNGHGAVRVQRHDRDRCAVLLERARPGDDLSTLPLKDAARIASDVARQLWVPAEPPFRSVHDFVPTWLSEVNASARVRELYETLDRRAHTLVHGDLHHHNILRDGDRWLAIDSKAMLSEPEFDVAPMLWNPVLGDHPKPATHDRRSQLAGFEVITEARSVRFRQRQGSRPASRLHRGRARRRADSGLGVDSRDVSRACRCGCAARLIRSVVVAAYRGVYVSVAVVRLER